MKKIRYEVLQFVNNDKNYPILTAIAAGLYPLLFYYNSNYTFVNSWTQLGFFILYFLVVPSLVFILVSIVFTRSKQLTRYKRLALTILNFVLFAFLLILCTIGIQSKLTLWFLILAFGLAFLLKKHLKKVAVFQLILAMFVAPKLLPDIYKELTYNPLWLDQPDDIEHVEFKKKPNIYVIQPDGYANFSELKKGYYQFDNSKFESFLRDRNFQFFDSFRSNYTSTLSSNSSLFAMNHHYYNSSKEGLKELFNARQVIAGDNPVISIFKNNDYKTFLMLERSYLLVNRPSLKYDYCNVDFSEISFLARGFDIEKNLMDDIKVQINKNESTANFFFIQRLSPGHVATYKSGSTGKEEERNHYLESLSKTNDWLIEIISFIEEKDENGIIMLLADHGGYVGMENTKQAREKQDDPDKVNSIFTSILAIKWPNGESQPDLKIASSVNVFRSLFSYLSEEKKYLEHLQEDKSYSIISSGAPLGVYELIDEQGHVVFKEFKN